MTYENNLEIIPDYILNIIHHCCMAPRQQNTVLGCIKGNKSFQVTRGKSLFIETPTYTLWPDLGIVLSEGPSQVRTDNSNKAVQTRNSIL